ncbi:FtsX-like permease family protein [Streptomyces sp. NBC_01275]|uniref:FtsX-like permease family protein n=1 Tax=Streptomyces sp. NBC_01275 TaxID=2903807 RepID=UPI00225B3455|nr:FtsX-like permease family protein [Streptomyces sp. NBC_01275]MCX4761993.1 FtsX-like permease family protein [Streptomyces sp. NBC_01275]
MRELLLGLRLLLGSGRGNRVRFLLMVVGSGIGVCCLAVVLAIPGILAAQDARKAAREPDCSNGRGSCLSTGGSGLALTRLDPYGSEPLTRIFVAMGKTPINPPPGLRELPDSGEVFVSPRLHELLRSDPGLAQLLPGREMGLISAQGLAQPDELYAYIGASREELKAGGHLTEFGGSDTRFPTVEPSTLDILRFTLAGVVLLPLAVFLSVCAQLSAAARMRRLAALRLLGLSRKGTQRVNASETVAAALLGAVLGLGAYWVVNQLVSRIGLPGFKWYPADGSLPVIALFICLAGCPAMAWFVGRVGAKKAAANPLAVRRSAVEKAPRLWGLLPLVPGVGIVIGYCVAGATGHAPTDTGLSSILMPLAVVLVGTGLVLSLPVLSRALARQVARSTGSLSLGLAMRRNEAEPGGAIRVATGLVMLVYAASLTQGVLIELDQVSKNTAPVQLYTMRLGDVPENKERALTKVPGVRSHVILAESWTDSNSEEWPTSISAVIATCGQLRRMASAVENCVDGRPARLMVPDHMYDEHSKPGSRFPFHLRNSEGQRRVVTVQVPRQTVRYHDDTAAQMVGSGTVLIPPSSFPAGFRPEGEATLALLSSAAPEAVRSVLEGIAGVDPTIEVEAHGVDAAALQQITVIKTLLAVGMVLGLIIGVAAYFVAATDRAVERRPQVTALALLGARPRTLRAVQFAQVVLPLGIGLVLAVVTGKMAESSYLVTGGGAIFWDGAGLPLLLASALGVVVVAALGSLPLIGRRIDPELIRRD